MINFPRSYNDSPLKILYKLITTLFLVYLYIDVTVGSSSSSNSGGNSEVNTITLYYNALPNQCTQSKPCNFDDIHHWVDGQAPNCSSSSGDTVIVYIISNDTLSSSSSSTSYIIWNSPCSISKLICNGSGSNDENKPSVWLTIELDNSQSIFDLQLNSQSKVNLTRDLNVGLFQMNDTSDIYVLNSTLQVGAVMTMDYNTTMTIDQTGYLTTLDNAFISGRITGGGYGITIDTNWYVDGGEIYSQSGSIIYYGSIVLSNNASIVLSNNTINNLLVLSNSSYSFGTDCQYNLTIYDNATLFVTQFQTPTPITPSSLDTIPTFYQLDQRIGSEIILSSIPRFEVQGITQSQGTIHLNNVTHMSFNTPGGIINHLKVSVPLSKTTTIDIINTTLEYLTLGTVQRGSTIVLQGIMENHINHSSVLQNIILNLTATSVPVIFNIDGFLNMASGSIVSNTHYETDSILNINPGSILYTPSIKFNGRDTLININNATVSIPLLQVQFGDLQVVGDSSKIMGAVQMLNTSNLALSSPNTFINGRLLVDSGSNTSIEQDITLHGDFIFVSGETYITPSAHINITGNFIMGMDNYLVTDFGTTIYFKVSDTSSQPMMMVDGNVDIKGGSINVSITDSIPDSSNFSKILIQTTPNKVFWLNDSVASNSGGPFIDLFDSEIRLQHHNDNSTSLYIIYTRRPGAPGRRPSAALTKAAIAAIVISIVLLIIAIGVLIYVVRRRNSKRSSGYHPLN